MTTVITIGRTPIDLEDPDQSVVFESLRAELLLPKLTTLTADTEVGRRARDLIAQLTTLARQIAALVDCPDPKRLAELLSERNDLWDRFVENLTGSY